jgi:ectoine hydroxylase-related dioxygenase (phytanoyl-CoA dioxygenase family)
MISQAFPCVRVIQPGEFSLGVHCDAAYGFTPSNINIVVPLTPTTRQSGCSALYVESSIGQEDWHSLVPLDQPIDGKAFRFWGSQCLHWTSENNTDVTRVSLDFRIVLGFVWSHLEKSNSLDAYASKPGYYACARRHVLSNGSTQWRNDNPLLPPDVRLGYPFTLK